MVECLLPVLLAVACAACAERNIGQTSLPDSAEKIRLSVVPMLVKLPDQETSYDIQGTGFFIHEGGLIATASHVANTPNLYTIFKNEIFRCSLVLPQFTVTYNADDPNRRKQHVWDIGLVKIEGAQGPFPPVRLSAKTDFGVGESAAMYGYYDRGQSYTIGDSTSLAALLTSGIVSAAFSTSFGEIKLGSRLVLDITAGPGSSGSPAFDPESGEVIGVVCQGKQQLALSPGAKPNEVVVTRVPMGIAETEPIIQLREWLRKVAPTLGYR